MAAASERLPLGGDPAPPSLPLDDRPLLVATVDAEDLEEFSAEAADAMAAGADIVELRADLLNSLDVDELAAVTPGLPLLLTLRRRPHYSEGERLAILESLIPFVDYVDLEADIAAARLRSLLQLAHREGTRTILSTHLVGAVPPPDILAAAILAPRQQGLRSTVCKVVIEAATASDLHQLRLLSKRLAAASAPHEEGGKRTVRFALMATGPLGQLSRFLARSLGSVLLYGTLHEPSAVTEGQVELQYLHQLLPLHIEEGTELFGILGYPLALTLSPPMYNAAFAHTGRDAAYLPLAVRAPRLSAVVQALRDLGAGGCNVTHPYKEAVLEHADVLSPQTQMVGAANTLRFVKGSVEAHNTDIAGLETALQHAGIVTQGREVVILGAGGGARAAVAACSRSARVRIVGRDHVRARQVREELAGRLPVPVDDSPWESRSKACAEADVVINATPVGSVGILDGLPLEVSHLRPDAAVFDMAYHPQETMLVRSARKRGLRTADGRMMLLEQAVLAYHLFTSAPAPRVVMETALMTALSTLRSALQAPPSPGSIDAEGEEGGE